MATVTPKFSIIDDFLTTEWWDEYITAIHANFKLDDTPLIGIKGNIIEDSSEATWISSDGALNTTLAGDLTVSGNNILGAGGNVMTFSGQDVTFDDNVDITTSIGVGVAHAADRMVNIKQTGAKTVETFGQVITADATSSTASINKACLLVESTGTWDGAGAINYAIYGKATGGATNYGLYIESGLVYFGGTVGIGDTGHEGSGLTINQLANDNIILSLKSSDVGHDMTDFAETDTFGFDEKANATGGGLKIVGLTDDERPALELHGYVGVPGVESTNPGVVINTAESDEAGNIDDTGYNLLNVQNNGTTKLQVDAEGNLMIGDGTARYTNLDFIGNGDSAELIYDATDDELSIGTNIILFTNLKIHFRGDDVGIHSQEATYTDHFAAGGMRFGDSSAAAPTNYSMFGPTGNLTFAGSAGLYPRTLSQSAEPAAGTGATQLDTSETCFWIDSDDSKLYLCYNQAGTVKTVELT